MVAHILHCVVAVIFADWLRIGERAARLFTALDGVMDCSAPSAQQGLTLMSHRKVKGPLRNSVSGTSIEAASLERGLNVC